MEHLVLKGLRDNLGFRGLLGLKAMPVLKGKRVRQGYKDQEVSLVLRGRVAKLVQLDHRGSVGSKGFQVRKGLEASLAARGIAAVLVSVDLVVHVVQQVHVVQVSLVL